MALIPSELLKFPHHFRADIKSPAQKEKTSLPTPAQPKPLPLRETVEFFFSSRRRHTRCSRDWSSDVCSSDLEVERGGSGRSGGPLRHGEDHTRANHPRIASARRDPARRRVARRTRAAAHSRARADRKSVV